MARVISVEAERFPIAGTFTISRGSKTEAEVITCTISEGGHTRTRRMRSLQALWRDDGWRARRDRGHARPDRRRHRPARPARRHAGRRGAQRRRLRACGTWKPRSAASRWPHAIWPAPLRRWKPPTRCRSASRRRWRRRPAPTPARPLLKVKIGGDNDIARIRAVTQAAPDSRIILDANEGWTDDNIVANLAFAAEHGIALIEQPLPAGHDGILRHIAHPVPICADESVHEAKDLEALVGLYDAVNIKLDKSGGLTAALVAARPRPRTGLLASWSAAWSARRWRWRRRCCWRRTPISSTSTVRCCLPATACPVSSTRDRWSHRRTGAVGLSARQARSAPGRSMRDRDHRQRSRRRRAGHRAGRKPASRRP